ncbi:MAG: hypothetical protein JF588_11940 [Caulobacterales bacterium]|nr:hypothetical protein [Caulobacterales bacterium]
MTVGLPSAVQIIMAWRVNKWIVERNAMEVGRYAYRGHAMARVRALAADAQREGLECYLLIREKDGAWRERPCPGGHADELDP